MKPRVGGATAPAPPQAATGGGPSVDPTGLAERMRGAASSARPGAGSRPGAGGGNDAAAVMAALRGVDFNGVESQVQKILDINTEYEFVIKEATAATAKESRNPMINLKLVVIWPLKDAGVVVYDQLVLTDTALWKAKSLFSAIGLVNDQGAYTGSSLAEMQDYAVRAAIMHDEYRGQVKNKIAGGYQEAYEHPDLQDQGGAAPAANGAAPPPNLGTQPDWQQPGLLPPPATAAA